MDERYWAKKYQEAEEERVDAQKCIEALEQVLKKRTEHIEELEKKIVRLEEELEGVQEYHFEDQAEISRLLLTVGRLLRKIESRDVSRVVNK